MRWCKAHPAAPIVNTLLLLLLPLSYLAAAMPPGAAPTPATAQSSHRYHDLQAVAAAAPQPVTVTVTVDSNGNAPLLTNQAASTSLPIPLAMSSLSTLPPREIASAYASAMHSLQGDWAQQMALVQGNASRAVEEVRISMASWTMAMSKEFRSREMESAYTWAWHCNRWKAQNRVEGVGA